MLLPLLLLLAPPSQPTRMEPLPSPPTTLAVDPSQVKRISQALRELLRTALPDPLYEKRTGEGRTAPTPNGLKWHGLVPKVQYADKNDGPRRHLRLTSAAGKEQLNVELRRVLRHEQGRLTFEVHLALPARMEFSEERWKNGVRLYDSSVRARLNLFLTLRCESKLRVESKNGLPEVVYRLRVEDTEFAYTDLVFEHVAGLGGEAARLIGDLAVDALRQWKPSIERRLREKLEDRIVKAADTREIRLGLDGLQRSHKTQPTRPK